MAEKRGRNDPCWCGSGKKYKKCHLNRSRMPRLPLKAITHGVGERWARKECLHPEASNGKCTRIIAAHTVSRSLVLQNIVDSTNHVLTFNRVLDGPPRRVGWKDASTFTGFCSFHDSDTFKAIDSEPFVGTPRQCLLVAYRAACFEVYQKTSGEAAGEYIREYGDRGYSEDVQRIVQSTSLWIDKGRRKGLEAFRSLKRDLEDSLTLEDYGNWSRLIVWFKGPMSVVSTAAISPNRTLDGDAIQVLHDTDASQQQSLLYGTVSSGDGGAVVMVWPQQQPAPRQFVQSILGRGRECLPHVVVQIMFAYAENTYFSPKWWNGLSSEQKMLVTDLARVVNAYYGHIPYKPMALVPWADVEIDLVDTMTN